MKKVFLTILAITYLAVSSGAMINLHYCMGKLLSWDMSANTKSKCGSCGMEKSGHKGCCHDEKKRLEIDKDQKAAESGFHFTPISWATVAELHGLLPSADIVKCGIDQPIAHAPPLSEKIPIFILHCNFRI